MEWQICLVNLILPLIYKILINVKTKTISPRKILLGYDAVSTLYPHIPPLSHWRAWEYAAYQNYRIKGRVLDLGCGDGKYFRLIWPKVKDVIGVDMNPAVAELGRKSGVYQNLHVTPAHQIPEMDESFDHVFANCSLEHMDNLEAVLTEIKRCLKPGGTLLCSVVTNRFVQWSILSNILAEAGYEKESSLQKKNFLEYHNLTNALAVNEWVNQFKTAGLETEEHIPIMPKFNNALWMLMDSLWHTKLRDGGELGNLIYPLLTENKKFTVAFRKIFSGLLEMESNFLDCSGAVFLVKKPEKN